MTAIKLNKSDHFVHNKQIKHVFFDLDGTVIKKDKSVSDAVKASFKRLKQSGVTYSAATGRPMFSVKDLLKEMEVDAPCVTFSGALISLPHQPAIRMAAFAPQQVLALLERMQHYQLTAELYTPEKYFVSEFNDLVATHTALLAFQPEVTDLKLIAVNTNDIIKVEALVSMPADLERFNAFCSEFPELAFDNAVGANRSDLLYSNITRQKNLRDDSFKYVAEYLNISADQIFAIGDAHSDLSYIQKAGIGVAMANSTQELIAAADYLTASVEEDGAALALDQLISAP